MAEPRLGADTLHARLLGIELPWMEIEHRRLAVDCIDASDRPPRHHVRQEPKIPSPAGRPVGAKHAHRRDGKLEHTGRAFVRESRPVRLSVMIVPDRIDTGAVAVTGFADAIECPSVPRP